MLVVLICITVLYLLSRFVLFSMYKKVRKDYRTLPTEQFFPNIQHSNIDFSAGPKLPVQSDDTLKILNQWKFYYLLNSKIEFMGTLFIVIVGVVLAQQELWAIAIPIVIMIFNVVTTMEDPDSTKSLFL